MFGRWKKREDQGGYYHEYSILNSVEISVENKKKKFKGSCRRRQNTSMDKEEGKIQTGVKENKR